MQRVWRGMLFGVGKIGCKAVAFYRSIQQHCKRSNRHVQVAWRTRATWLKPRVESPTLVQDSTNLPGRLLKSARTLPSSRYCLSLKAVCYLYLLCYPQPEDTKSSLECSSMLLTANACRFIKDHWKLSNCSGNFSALFVHLVNQTASSTALCTLSLVYWLVTFEFLICGKCCRSNNPENLIERATIQHVTGSMPSVSVDLWPESRSWRNNRHDDLFPGSARLPAAHRALLPPAEHVRQGESGSAEHLGRDDRVGFGQRHFAYPGLLTLERQCG